MQLINIQEVKPNENNPRFIKDYKFKKLVKSIKEFPQMLKLRPIVVNSDMVVLGGNMRLKACKEAGLKEVYILKADDLTEEQQREFIVKDNVGFGEWDWDVLGNERNTQQLGDWGLEVWQGGEDVSNTNDYSNLDVDSKLDKFLDAKIKNLTIPFESQEFDEVILKLEVYLEKYNLVDYKEMVYKIIEDEKL